MWKPILKHENGRILAEIKPYGDKFEALIVITPFDCKGDNMSLSSCKFDDIEGAQTWVSNVLKAWSGAFAESSIQTQIPQ